MCVRTYSGHGSILYWKNHCCASWVDILMMFSLPTISVSIQTNHPQSSLWFTSDLWFQRIPACMVVHAGRSILNSRLPSVMQCITSIRIYSWSLCRSFIGSFQKSVPCCGVVGSRSRMSFLIVLHTKRGRTGPGPRRRLSAMGEGGIELFETKQVRTVMSLVLLLLLLYSTSRTV